MNRNPNPTHRQRGVSLTESLIVLSIASIVVGAAVPNFAKARELRRLEATAAQLETDIQLARSEAVARAVPVRIGFETQTSGSCYVVHTGSAGDCRCDATGLAVCRPGAQALRTVRLDDLASLRVSSSSTSILLDPARGTVTPTATVRVIAGAVAIHKVVNIMGRIRSCSPAPALAGYRAC